MYVLSVYKLLTKNNLRQSPELVLNILKMLTNDTFQSTVRFIKIFRIFIKTKIIFSLYIILVFRKYGLSCMFKLIRIFGRLFLYYKLYKLK